MSGRAGNPEPLPLHQPVLLAEVRHWLAPVSGGLYVDGNLGLGGHAEMILEASSPAGRLLAFDWDEAALGLARARLARFGTRVLFFQRNFAELESVLAELGVDRIDGLLLDLGLSSLQLDGSGRGFSFRGDEPLDMRMDIRRPRTAADLLNTNTAEELADIFYYYGEERQARRIAAAVVAARRLAPLATTGQLVAVVEGAVPRRFHPPRIHVATKVFQALRIAVNEELVNLETILAEAPARLRSGGRFCVISFHSLEDRLVKNAFRRESGLRELTPRPVVPAEAECRANPRARSAKLRVAVRTEGTA